MSNSLNEIIETSSRGTLVLISGSVFSSLVLAVGLLVVARLLGPDQYGVYTLCFVLPSLLILVTDLGLNAGLVRFSAYYCSKGQTRQVAKVLRHCFVLKTIIFMNLFVIAFAFSDYFATILLNRPEMGYLVRWGSLLIPFQITLDYVTSAFVGLEHMSSVAFLNVLQSVIKVAMSIGLILLGFGVLGALTGQIAGVLVAEIFAVIVLSRNYRGLIQKDANNTLNISFRDNVKALFTYGLPLYLTILTGGLAPQYQTIVLAHFALNEEIGNFRAALNLLTLVTMISAPITTSLFPAFSKLDPESEAIKRFFQLSVKYMTILVVPTTFLVLLFTREITYIAYGSSFTSTALFLFVFCTSYLLVGLGSLVQMEFYKGTANTMVNFRIIMVYFLLLLPLTPLFTFFYGVVGLIIVQLVASFCSITYGLRVAVSRFHIVFQWKDLTKIYIVSTVSALPVTVFSYYFSFWWLWKAIIGTAMYLIVWLTIMPLTNTLKTPELQKIRTLLERIPLFGRILVPIISYEQKLTGKKTVV